MEFGFCIECNTLTPNLLCDDCAARLEVEWVESQNGIVNSKPSTLSLMTLVLRLTSGRAMEFGFCIECNTLTPNLLCDDCAARFKVEWVKSQNGIVNSKPSTLSLMTLVLRLTSGSEGKNRVTCMYCGKETNEPTFHSDEHRKDCDWRRRRFWASP